ncbi:MAG: hypothetical protein HQL29_05085 [Candidatus Omnitrophica bacterium]|nr:hypothetical protein [Candidatus Omnitrophota bacterium]
MKNKIPKAYTLLFTILFSLLQVSHSFGYENLAPPVTYAVDNSGNATQLEIGSIINSNAIGKGQKLLDFLNGKLPPKISLKNKLAEGVLDKLNEAIEQALLIDAQNSSLVPAEYKEITENARKGLVEFQDNLKTMLHLYEGVKQVVWKENFLLGFSQRKLNKKLKKIGLSVELINILYRKSPLRLAQYIHHECFSEEQLAKNIMRNLKSDDEKEENYYGAHRDVIDLIQTKIYGVDEVKALKNDLRSFIEPAILVLNCGSSSVKYTLYNVRTGEVMKDRTLDQIGDNIKDKVNTHAEAIEKILSEIDCVPVAVGHRFVHGADIYDKSVLIDDDVMANLKMLSSENFSDKNNKNYAPLHNPKNFLGIQRIEELLPGVPNVAVFDTAFHLGMPEIATTYSLPGEYGKKYRKYGFHGTSHRYVYGKATEELKNNKKSAYYINTAKKIDKRTGKLKFAKEPNIITVHLGNGASIAAIRNGQVIDTSMGFTPLSGLIMGTRTGDIDAGVVLDMIAGIGNDRDFVDLVIKKYLDKGGNDDSAKKRIKNILFAKNDLTGELKLNAIKELLGDAEGIGLLVSVLDDIRKEVESIASFTVASATKKESDILNKQSGMMGISDLTKDCRDLEKAAKEGNAKARLALDAFKYRVKKYIYEYYGRLCEGDQQVDAIIFTGGIGSGKGTADELVKEIKKWIISDKKARLTTDVKKAVMSQKKNWMPLVDKMKTDEEVVIMRDTLELSNHIIFGQPDKAAKKAKVNEVKDLESFRKKVQVQESQFRSHLEAELKNGKEIVFGFDNTLGLGVNPGMTHIWKTVRDLADMKNADGDLIYPNLRIIGGDGSLDAGQRGGLLAKAIFQTTEEGVKPENIFLVVKDSNLVNSDYNKLLGQSWVVGIDDKETTYLPVLEAFNVMLMASSEVEEDSILKVLENITDKIITVEDLRIFIKERLLYITPKAKAYNAQDLVDKNIIVKEVYTKA